MITPDEALDFFRVVALLSFSAVLLMVVCMFGYLGYQLIKQDKPR